MAVQARQATASDMIPAQLLNTTKEATMSNAMTSGTRVHSPDLDWSQVRETVLMLELSSGQIEAAMTDSNSSVEVLTGSFTTLADHIRMIGDTVEALPDEGETGIAKASLQGVTGNVSNLVHQAIVAFQFYDKLVQRMAHVNHSLSALSELVADNTRLFNPAEWRGLQEKIRSKYSMQEEQAMFEAVMRGVPVKEALEQFMSQLNNKTDDIELF